MQIWKTFFFYLVVLIILFSTRDSVRPVARLTFRLKQPTALVRGGGMLTKNYFQCYLPVYGPVVAG